MSFNKLASETVKAFFKSNNEYQHLSDNSFQYFLENLFRNGLKVSDVGEMRENSVLVENSILVYCTNKTGLRQFTNDFMRSNIINYDINIVMVFCFDKNAQIKRLSDSQVFKD